MNVADPAAVNCNGLKTILASVLSIFIKGNPFFSNGPKGLLENPRNGPVLCKYIVPYF